MAAIPSEELHILFLCQWDMKISHGNLALKETTPLDTTIVWFDTPWAGVDEETNKAPEDDELGRLRMTRTMGERFVILRDRFRGRYYADVYRF